MQFTKWSFSVVYTLIYLLIVKASGIISISGSSYPLLALLSNVLLLLLTVVVGYLFIDQLEKKRFRIFIDSINNKLTLLLISVYASFAILCHFIFFESGVLQVSFLDICVFVLFAFWVIPFELIFLLLIETLRNYINNNHRKNSVHSIEGIQRLRLTVFIIMVVVWGIYLAGFNPGNMSSDSISQWGQAHGIYPLNDWHPVSHTLFIRGLTHIYDSPITVSIFQILFFAAIASSFLALLYKYGLPKKWIVAFTMLFALVPTNGINVVTLWKDIVYSISLLWLTLIFVRIAGARKALHMLVLIEITVALCAAALFRHNGIVVYSASILFFLILLVKFKMKRLLYPVMLSAIFIAGVKGLLYPSVHVIENPPGIKLVAPVHGIASVIYHNGSLSKGTAAKMENIAPLDTWRALYNPYSANPYMFENSHNFVEKLSAYSSRSVLSMYIDTFIRNPGMIIYDRLTGMNTLWDVTQPADNSLTYPYSVTLEENQLGLARKENVITMLISKAAFITTEIGFTNALLWRTGIYMILFFLILFYWFVKAERLNFVLMIPLAANILSLLLSMSWQDYRYVYAIFVIFWFIFLFTIVSDRNEQGLAHKP